MPTRLFRITLFLLLFATARGQTPSVPAWQTAAGGKMSFEVASIHLSKPGTFTRPSFPLSADDSFRQTGGVFIADFPLIVYIEFAYKIWPSREQVDAMLAPLPKWVDTDHYTINAKSAIPNPTKDQMRLMVQSLLAERFGLTVHFESREFAVLAMILEKPGKLGPSLLPHSKGPACEEPAEGAPVCGTYSAYVGKDGRWKADSRNTTMDLIGDFLSSFGNLGRPVVDRTTISERVDFNLEFVRDATTSPPGAPEPPVDTQGPTFLEAVKDQLGLKLTSAKAPVQSLIIDHVEKPTEN